MPRATGTAETDPMLEPWMLWKREASRQRRDSPEGSRDQAKGQMDPHV